MALGFVEMVFALLRKWACSVSCRKLKNMKRGIVCMGGGGVFIPEPPAINCLAAHHLDVARSCPNLAEKRRVNKGGQGIHTPENPLYIAVPSFV